MTVNHVIWVAQNLEHFTLDRNCGVENNTKKRYNFESIVEEYL